MQWGSDTYRRGALERIEDARLLKDKRYALSMYSAGLAVEGMLRSLHWIEDKQFDSRHDLKRLAQRIGELGLLRSGGRDHDFVGLVTDVAKHWTNDLRFADQGQLERFLLDTGSAKTRDKGEIARICQEHFDRCSEVVNRCNVLWSRRRRGA